MFKSLWIWGGWSDPFMHPNVKYCLGKDHLWTWNPSILKDWDFTVLVGIHVQEDWVCVPLPILWNLVVFVVFISTPEHEDTCCGFFCWEYRKVVWDRRRGAQESCKGSLCCSHWLWFCLPEEFWNNIWWCKLTLICFLYWHLIKSLWGWWMQISFCPWSFLLIRLE